MQRGKLRQKQGAPPLLLGLILPGLLGSMLPDLRDAGDAGRAWMVQPAIVELTGHCFRCVDRFAVLACRDGDGMTERSKRAIRGDLVSALAVTLALSSPAFGATLQGTLSTSSDKGPSTTSVAAAGRKPGSQHATSAISTSGSKAQARNTRERVTKPRTIAKVTKPVGHSAGQERVSNLPIKHVALGNGGKFDHTLIDDGTFWHERGSVTTWQQTGMASWYGGSRWQGHRTSSGERYDQNQLTAAHATLPIGTKVRVVRADGRASVVVTINDRPGTRTRIIDLSREAAKELGMLSSGLAMVTLQPM